MAIENKKKKSKRVQGSSSSKVILSGEHSVIYGYPAIVLPFPLRVFVEIETNDSSQTIEIISSLYSGEASHLPKALRGLYSCILEVAKDLNRKAENLKISVRSNIPMARGLGSSAAVAIALVRALYRFWEEPLAEESLLYYVMQAEDYCHGKSSGIDMKTEVWEKPLYFIEKEKFQMLDIPKPLYLVVADSGYIGETKEAVAHVRQQYERTIKAKDDLEKIGKITENMVKALKNCDLYQIGHYMNLNHHYLRELGVSSPVLEKLVDLAQSQGALGSKMTGGGLGGCIIALAETAKQAEKISRALSKETERQSWWFDTGEGKLHGHKRPMLTQREKERSSL